MTPSTNQLWDEARFVLELLPEENLDDIKKRVEESKFFGMIRFARRNKQINRLKMLLNL